ncbi:GDSL esterase/lipase At1g28640-like [Triticum aestivum]|uniref:GDSL esterase/lipase At1g28640-like n=1 Tax=Triticum aestivum TaxID=4565 RepID=UPI001D02D2A1|nr:GDSL esterase/lipase At1g28640-like [Triticum aestivum]
MAMIGGTARDYSGTSMFTGYGVHLDGSMDSQMEALRRLLPCICGTRQSCKEYLAKSLFVFQLGENGYNIQLVNGSTLHEARKSIPSIVNTITSGVEKLITLGAVDIMVSNVAPMGCYPLYLNFFESSDKGDYDEYGCLRNHNALFDRHNSFLKNGLRKLQKKHQHTRIMHADLASQIYQMVQDPKKFGFVIGTILMGCCGKANAPNGFDLLAMCGMDGSSVCHDPGSHLTWDGMHLSDAANKHIAEGWLSGTYCRPPILW